MSDKQEPAPDMHRRIIVMNVLVIVFTAVLMVLWEPWADDDAPEDNAPAANSSLSGDANAGNAPKEIPIEMTRDDAPLQADVDPRLITRQTQSDAEAILRAQEAGFDTAETCTLLHLFVGFEEEPMRKLHRWASKYGYRVSAIHEDFKDGRANWQLYFREDSRLVLEEVSRATSRMLRIAEYFGVEYRSWGAER